jgi:hypothetical protein
MVATLVCIPKSIPVLNRTETLDVCKAEVGVMNENELSALRHAANGMLLFHNGLWGARAGYWWAGPDGSSAGKVPPWESEVLDLLERRRLVSICPVTGALNIPVVPTEAGLRILSTVDSAAAA